MKIHNPIERMTNAWGNLSGFEKSQTFYNLVEFLGVFLQFEVFTKRPNGPLPNVACGLSIMTYFLTFYTLCYYVYSGDFIKAIPTFCMFGIVVSVRSRSLYNNV